MCNYTQTEVLVVLLINSFTEFPFVLFHLFLPTSFRYIRICDKGNKNPKTKVCFLHLALLLTISPFVLSLGIRR